MPEESTKYVVNIFYCYARVDRDLRDELDKHLSALERSKKIITWHDRKILPGANWSQEIDTHLNDAEVILLLITANFISSDYCYGVEMQRALEMHEKGIAHVIPVLLRSCRWKETPIGQLQVLPTDGRPVNQWRNRDEAFEDVVDGISKVVAVRGHLIKSTRERTRRVRIELLKQARLEKGLTLEEVAKKIETVAIVLGRWENGDILPYLYYRQRLCELYEKTPLELGFEDQ
jgi:DNA-binding XRE family transcriptional regulator